MTEAKTEKTDFPFIPPPAPPAPPPPPKLGRKPEHAAFATFCGCVAAVMLIVTVSVSVPGQAMIAAIATACSVALLCCSIAAFYGALEE